MHVRCCCRLLDLGKDVEAGEACRNTLVIICNILLSVSKTHAKTSERPTLSRYTIMMVN